MPKRCGLFGYYWASNKGGATVADRHGAGAKTRPARFSDLARSSAS